MNAKIVQKANTIKILLLLSLCLYGCNPNSCILQPDIHYTPQHSCIEHLPSTFPPLTEEELKEDWGKELKIAMAFGRTLDLYRAITGFRRALILLPPEEGTRRLQIEFSIIESYYYGGKYQDAIEEFQHSHLTHATGKFPAFGELLIILYDCYKEIGEEEKACQILELIERHHPDTASDLSLFAAFEAGNLAELAAVSPSHRSYEATSCFLNWYYCNRKSVRTAQTLNAALPGAGFLYVGQPKTALTSLAINTLFIAAAYHFFHHGNIAAGVITTSLEAGWYFGGINGAGLAAKEYNEYLYRTGGRDTMITEKLFPILMFETSF